MYKELECPYCDADQEAQHEGGFEEDKTYYQKCSYCGKSFIYSAFISIDLNTEKADCLNDDNHNWKPTHTFPKIATKMRCTICYDERQPTKEEREKYELYDPPTN